VTAPQLTVYVVYDSPRDCPGRFVVRTRHNETPGAVAMITESYDEVLELMEGLGLYRIPRYPDDDVAIKEVWL
jgi:hypothetical protein